MPYGRGLHKRIIADVWTWAGDYRTGNKNLGVEHGIIVPRCTRSMTRLDIGWITRHAHPPKFGHGTSAPCKQPTISTLPPLFNLHARDPGISKICVAFKARSLCSAIGRTDCAASYD